MNKLFYSTINLKVIYDRSQPLNSRSETSIYCQVNTVLFKAYRSFFSNIFFKV